MYIHFYDSLSLSLSPPLSLSLSVQVGASYVCVCVCVCVCVYICMGLYMGRQDLVVNVPLGDLFGATSHARV
jgi:hypothetical protein